MGTILHKMVPVSWLYLETEVKHLLRGMVLLVDVFSKLLLLIRNTNKIGYEWYLQRNIVARSRNDYASRLSWQPDAISVQESAFMAI